MGDESSSETQSNGKLAALQDTLDSDQVAYVNTLSDDIETVVDEASTLQRYDYVIGEVSNHFVSPTDHIHFDLVHGDEEEEPLRCVIAPSHQAPVTTDIENGRLVAVAGDLSFVTPKNRCSIEVEEVVPLGDDGSHPFYEVILARLWIAIVAVLVIVLGLGGYVFLL